MRTTSPLILATNGDGQAQLSIRELSHRIAERRWLVLGIAAVVFLAVAIYTFAVTPRYSSEALLRIETDNKGASALSALADQASSSVPGGGGGGGGIGASLLGGLGRDELESEIGVLKSDRVADAMIDSLALGTRLEKPNVSRASILSARVIQPDVDADGKLTLTRVAGGRYTLERDDLDDVTGLPAAVTPGAPIQVGGTVVTLNPKLLSGGPAKIVLRFLPRYKVHKLLDKRLLIERQEGGSRLVEVSFEDPDRLLAAQVVRVLVDEYVRYSVGTERYQDTTTVADLRLQVDSTATELAASEVALRGYEEQSRLISPEDQATAQVKRISAISSKVDEISTERNALQRMLALISERSRGGTDPTAYRQLGTFPSLITNRAIQDLLQTLIDLENKRSELTVRRTDADPDVAQLTKRIVDVENQLYTIGPQYLESLDQQLAMTVRTASAVTDTLDEMPGQAMEYGRLLRERKLLEATYLALQKELKEAELVDVLRQDKVNVVDTPRVANPKDKAFPKKIVMLPLGAILGLFLGLSVALFIELWRQPEVLDLRPTT